MLATPLNITMQTTAISVALKIFVKLKKLLYIAKWKRLSASEVKPIKDSEVNHIKIGIVIPIMNCLVHLENSFKAIAISIAITEYIIAAKRIAVLLNPKSLNNGGIKTSSKIKEQATAIISGDFIMLSKENITPDHSSLFLAF